MPRSPAAPPPRDGLRADGAGLRGVGAGVAAVVRGLGAWLRRALAPAPGGARVDGIHERFRIFRRLLDRNHQILRVIADMEEKARGEYLFDRSYLSRCVEILRSALDDLAADLVAIGGREYLPFAERARAVVAEVAAEAEGRPQVREDRLVRPLAEVGSADAWSVGAKNAQLGELASRGALPTPDGFAVTAWAYRRFLEASGLEGAIAERLAALDLRSYDDLVRASEAIRRAILAAPLPAELEAALREATAELAARSGCRFLAVRSSAVGEDGELSFAGQYRSELNVPLKRVAEAYRRVVAGKFTPGAIYYLASHGLREADTPMSVGVVEMVDAEAAGVVYTRDPVDADADVVVIHAVRGLGAPLVSGRSSPDVYRVARRDREPLEVRVAEQSVRLVALPGGGVREEPVPPEAARSPALAADTVKRLAELALRAEAIYGGACDIEWALDRGGRLVLLQCRPLRTYRRRGDAEVPRPLGSAVLLEGGCTASPGAGCGRVHRVSGSADLDGVPAGAVLVAERPLPGLVAVMDRVAALVTAAGGAASHVATLARERGLPALVGVGDVSALREGVPVTVDATAGVVYAGEHPELVAARRQGHEPLTEEPIYARLRRMLTRVAPLHLVHPSTPDFQISSCRTVHDLTRFAHQRAMEELFRAAQSARLSRRAGVRLRSPLPLPVTVVHLERDLTGRAVRGEVALEDVSCPPFEAFWGGMEREGWPRPPTVDGRGFLSVMATHMTRSPHAEFLEESFAILTGEYVLLSLRMGYHFTTVEALTTDDPARNWIRMQYKEGGASVDRRVRRIRILDAILRRLGFDSSTAGDFLDTQIQYVPRERALELLGLLGRLNILTKQLDMALANDRIAAWYERDIAGKLGLGGGEEVG